jgi:predicted RNA-binding protein (virulence factor B family)
MMGNLKLSKIKTKDFLVTKDELPINIWFIINSTLHLYLYIKEEDGVCGTIQCF